MKYDHHDYLVMSRINRHIEVANKIFATETVAAKLEAAWSANVREREKSAAAATNLVGRDSDHYFAGRKSTSAVAAYAGGSKAAKVVVAAGGQVVNQFYDTLKLVSFAQESLTGGPGFMRSEASLPNAPVGGTLWFTRGEVDALGDDSAAKTALRYHKVI